MPRKYIARVQNAPRHKGERSRASSITMDNQLWDRINACAKRRGTSRSFFVATVMKRHLDLLDRDDYQRTHVVPMNSFAGPLNKSLVGLVR